MVGVVPASNRVSLVVQLHLIGREPTHQVQMAVAAVALTATALTITDWPVVTEAAVVADTARQTSVLVAQEPKATAGVRATLAAQVAAAVRTVLVVAAGREAMMLGVPVAPAAAVSTSPHSASTVLVVAGRQVDQALVALLVTAAAVLEVGL